MLGFEVRTVIGAAYCCVVTDAFGQDTVEVTVCHPSDGHFDTLYHKRARSAVGFVSVSVSFNRGVEDQIAVATWVTFVRTLLLECFEEHRTVLAGE